MGSAMLDRAIVDATALREAALKSAEQAVINKYSNQIKEAVEDLLEADDPFAGDPLAGDMGAEPAAGPFDAAGPDAPKDKDTNLAEEVGGVDAQIPLAALEELMQDVDEDTILEIELPNLSLDDPSLTLGVGPDKITPAGSPGGTGVMAESYDQQEEQGAATGRADASDVVDLEDGDLQNLAESLDFDFKAQPGGGFANGQMTPTNEIHDTVEVSEVANAIEEYNDELEEKNDKLKKENKKLKSQLKKYTNINKRVVEAVDKLKQKFKEVQLMNAKLLYSNKVLVDGSLNERQKKEIVESIQKVGSTEQAKMVYETLQNAVGTVTSQKSGPKSLSEAAQHRSMSSLLLKASKQSKEEKIDPAKNRWQTLAGIKSKA